MQELDLKRYGKPQAFAQLRESAGLIQHLEQHTEVSYQLLQQQEHGLCQLQVPQANLLNPMLDCFNDQSRFTITQINDTSVELMVHDDIELPSAGFLKQTQHIIDPAAVAQSLDEYWTQMRTRDSHRELQEPEAWPEFLTLLDHVEPMHPLLVDFIDLPTWKQAIKAMNSKTARGCCGWSVDELKMLPDVL